MKSPCSLARLESALAGNLPADDEGCLHQHLEECEACGAALERMAGGAAWCQEAAALLTADELDATAPVSDQWSEIDFTVDHLEPADEPDLLGRLGGYDVLEIIGHGGMGVVLKAFDRELKRCVAIKVLAPHLAQSSLARQRFVREAQAAAAVVHPHVLAIHQVQPSGRLPFLVMPLVAGESLAERLTAQGTLELKEILRIGLQAAAGLAAAHEQGLVHRDVKPANILLEKGVERAVLTDFGLARAADDVALTRWGIIAGTPQYMSPEQARGEPLDGRSDLFSLGCVLYELATGVSPFRADSLLATMRRLVDDPPPAMASLRPELPPWFIAIVERLLQKDPARRFGSAKEVSQLLEGCLAHVQQPASVPLPPGLPKPVVRGPWRSRNVLTKGVLAMLGALGVGVLGLFLVAAQPPEIAGQWSGDDWGQVILKKTDDGQYAGTYNDTFGKQPGEIKLKWSLVERRYYGTWREGEDRFGDLSLRLVGDEIRGAWTTDAKSKIQSAVPRLADLAWTRSKAPATQLKGARFGPVLEREVRNREAIDLDTDTRAMMPDAELDPKKGLLWVFEQRLGSLTDWMAEEKMDALSDATSLTGFGLKVNELTSADWDAMDPSQLAAALQVDWEKVDPRQFAKAIHTIDPKAPPHVILAQRAGPRTIAFQTREGGMGILQILETTKAGLKVRFKLSSVKPEATRPQSPKNLEDVRLRINFIQTPWKEVLEWLAEEADLSVAGDNLPAGTFNYRDNRRYTVPQTIEVLNDVLRPRGFLLLLKDRTLVVQNLEDKAPGTGDSSQGDELRFSETKEVVLSAGSSKFMLDFDSGKTMDMPATVGRPEQKQMDVQTDQVQPYHYPKELIGLGLQGVEVKASDWDASAADVRRALGGDAVGPLKQMDLGPEKHPTYFFKTRDDALGVLQLLEIVDEPKGIRLRYKTVVGAAAKPSDPVAPEKLKAEFLRQAGDSAAAGKLYDRIAADEHLRAVLTEALQFPERRGILYAAELWRVWREAASPKAKEGGVPATDAAVCFYLGCDPASADALRVYPVPAEATEGFRTHETLILSMAVRMELFAEDRKEPFDRLIAGWTAARADPWTRELAIETAREYRLTAMVPVVRQMATDAEIEARFRAPAITLLAQFGGQDERPLLRKLLAHGGVCHTRKLTIKGEDAPTATAQIRDVALGCLLLLDGTDMRAAGFDELNFFPEPLKPHEYFRGAPFGFFSAEKRNAIHAKFAALALPEDPPDDPTKGAANPPAGPKRLRQFSIKHRVGAIACSPDGELIAIADSDVTFPLTAEWKPVVEILDSKTGKTLAWLPLATDEQREALTTTEDLPHFEVGPLVFSPDGTVVAISTGLGQVKLFNARSGELIRSLDDEKARLADKATPEKLQSLPRAMGAVRSLVFSPDGSLLATCGDSFADVARHRGRIERGGLGERSSNRPGRLKVWDAKTGALKHDLVGHSQAFAVAFSPEGPWLVSAGQWSTAGNHGNGVLLWDLEKGAIHRTIVIEANGGTHAVVFSPHKKLAAIGSIIFDKENDTRSSAIRVAYPLSGITEWQQTIKDGAMPRAFLPDGKSIVVLSGRNSIRLIDAESGASRPEIKAAEGSLWIDLAVAPQAGLLIIAGAANEPRGSVEVWDVSPAPAAPDSKPDRSKRRTR